MNTEFQLRPATANDAKDIAELIVISSDGVALIDWAEQAETQQCHPLDIGERTYRQDHGNYSWRNCTIVEVDAKVAGLLLTFALPDGPKRKVTGRPSSNAENVFAPYMYLEEPNSWYICGVAVYPEYRSQGFGKRLMQLAEQQAKEKKFKKISLVAFDQNTKVVQLYKKLGYKVVDHAPVVKHPLIHYTGDALLMVAELR